VDVRAGAGLADRASGRIPPTAVHVVGVSAAEKGAWEAVNVTEHFERVSGAAAAARGIREFDLGKGAVRIGNDDPAWDAWKSPQYLVVLVNLRDQVNEGGRPDDPRRVIVSLNAKRWVRLAGDLVIEVTPAGVVVRSEQAPVAPGEF
jgi:hypothetical protein